MFNTYRDKKILFVLIPVVMFWLSALVADVDIDKKEPLKGESLETVKREEVIVPQLPVGDVALEVPSEDGPLIQEEVVEEVEDSKDMEEVSPYPEFTYSKDWGEEDSYLLAKIAKCEAGTESMHGKTLVILVVLNRVWNDDFPDTIEEVILQQSNGVYQFSPVRPGGSWWTLEPDEECWEAVRIVQESIYDYSEGALYFEGCKNKDNWHSRNLEFLYQVGGHRFYR